MTAPVLSGGLSSEPGGVALRAICAHAERAPAAHARNNEVTLPMAALGSAVDSLGPLVDGEDVILYGILRASIGVARALVTTVR